MSARSFRPWRAAWGLLALLVAGLWLAGCGGAPTPLPTVNPNAPTVLVPFTPESPDLALPTLLPTVVVPPTHVPVPEPATPVVIVVTATPPAPATIGKTNTAAPAATVPPQAATAPANSPTAAESATPFPQNVPKVYVTALSVDPATPKADLPPTFAVTFQNASGVDQGYNWGIEIWDPENQKNSKGVTTWQNSAMPVGTTHLTSTGWTVKGQGACLPYRARVVARDEDDNRMPFIQPDGSILWIDFSVCP